MNLRVFFIFLCLAFFPVLSWSSENIHINADQFEFDGVKDHIVAQGHVVVTQQGVTITSPRGDYVKKEQRISLYDGVKMVRNGMELTCDDAIADGGKDMIYAVGNVAFKFEDMDGTADRAEYDINAQQVVLLGHPIAKQGEDYITGEQVIVDLKQNKVITRGNAKVQLSVEKL